MSTYISIQYGITFGKCDSSDWIDRTTEIAGDAEAAYLRAKKLHLPFDKFSILNDVLNECYDEIAEDELDNMSGEEFVMECTGEAEMDPDEINDLVSERDEYTLDFFGLTDMSEEELDEWNAYDLEELPTILEFQEDFEPSSPFDSGWSLNVEYVEHPDEEDFGEDEARATIAELLDEADGDFTVLKDYVERCEWLYIGDVPLADVANEIAKEKGIKVEF